MPKRLQLPDGRLFEFPDDTTPEELSTFLGGIDDLGAGPPPPLPGGGVAPGPIPTPSLSTGENIASAAYESSPLPLFEKDNLPTTAAALAGGTAMALTGGLAAPVVAAGLAGGLSRGGVSLSEGKDVLEAGGDALREGVVQGGLQGIGAGVPKLIAGTGRQLYKWALPASAKSGLPNEVRALVDTGMDEGLNVTEGGYGKANQLITNLSGNVRKLVESISGQIDPQKAMGQIAGVRERLIKSAAPQADIEAVDAIAEQYAKQFTKPMSAVEAQETKQGIYGRLASAYDRNANPAAVDAQKAFASGLRSEIEQTGAAQGFPDIADLNARMGKVIDWRDAVSQHVSKSPAPGVMEVMAGTSLGSPAALGLGIARHAGVRSALGRTLGAARHLDPSRQLNRASSGMAESMPETPPSPTSMDALGIPEVPGVPFQADPLDAAGIPVSRGSVSSDDLWMRRFQPEPMISHTPPPTAHRTLDQLGIPENAGAPFERDVLSSLGIPEIQPTNSLDDLWLQRVLGSPGDPELLHQPLARYLERLRQQGQGGTWGVNTPPPTPFRVK